MKPDPLPLGDSLLSPKKLSRSQRSVPHSDLSTSPSSTISIRTHVSSPVRRKPLPPNVFPQILARSSSKHGASPDTPDQGLEANASESDAFVSPRRLKEVDRSSRGTFALRLLRNSSRSQPSSDLQNDNLPSLKGEASVSEHNLQLRTSSEPTLSAEAEVEESEVQERSSIMGLEHHMRTPPLRTDSAHRSFSTSGDETKKRHTPGSRTTSFLNWRNASSPGADSSSTRGSENGRSPMPSPSATSLQTSAYSSRSFPSALDVKANPSSIPHERFGRPISEMAKDDHPLIADQLENELKDISTELAMSIRRELDLEDMVERLQLEAPQPPHFSTHRTSDYFSDSGLSVRYHGSDVGVKADEMEKIKREAEQQRAQLKVELSQKWLDERARRKALESHVQLLEDQVTESRHEQMDTSGIMARARELEMALGDARRRLTEERQIKENFEDLSIALRCDLEHHRDERDNLRDEVVPQLKTQLDGLESSAAEAQKLSYDFARMQQELQALRNENATLNARKIQQEMQQNATSISSIAEESEPEPSSRHSFGQLSSLHLSRSNSLAHVRGHPRTGGFARSGSLSRSNSIGGPRSPMESKEFLADRLKDIEFQRDALHSALKSLLTRQDYQSRKYERRIQLLEIERDRALQSGSPRKLGYENEVRGLREEINYLRLRTDEALTQKWQCEKGLSGLKMDLDRSEQETSSLRTILREHDIAIPEQPSSSLQQAYNQLQQDRKQVEEWTNGGSELTRSLEEEQRLADQLRESAERSEALASQVRQQLTTNFSLRTRLADAIGKGESNQQASAAQINELQNKLRKLEDTVTLAQQQSEAAVTKHEEEVRIIQESHNHHLLRIKAGSRTPTLHQPSTRSPLSPMFAIGRRSPKLDKTSSGFGMTLHQALRTEYLEQKVMELEKALGIADKEMEDVVGRMNVAQIGVAELQSERDEALKRTRRLQAAIMAEREKVQGLMGESAQS